MKFIRRLLTFVISMKNRQALYTQVLRSKQLLLAILFNIFFPFSSEAQQYGPSETTEISILTVGPGANLYDKFGHSAFRIKDESKGLDMVYNYGTYDFNTPNFYTKFAQGKLLYVLSTSTFSDFYDYYVDQNRWVKEQTLLLTYEEKITLATYLSNNALPENRAYLYDFCFDNCATRIRDVLVTALKPKVEYPEEFLEENKTFRELIQQNVSANSWGSLGMDIAIGAVTDVEATDWEHQFLPQYVYEAAAVATITREGEKFPLVGETRVLFDTEGPNSNSSFFTSPLFVFGMIGLLILFLTYKDYRKGSRNRTLDAILFFTTGLIGVFLLLLWFATDHSATVNNYNVLWAFPLSLFLSFGIAKKNPKKWIRRYLIFLLLLLALLTLHSITGVQTFALTLIPIFIALAVRYLYLVYYLSPKRTPIETD